MKIGAILAPFGPSRGIIVGTYSEACNQLKKEGLVLDLRIENMVSAEQTMVEPNPDFMKWLEDEADIILAHIPAAYDVLFTELKGLGENTGKPIIPLAPECAALANRIHPNKFKTLWAYQSNGGLENVKNLIRFSFNITGFTQETAPHPIEMPFSGIYHPAHKEPFSTLEKYLAWRPFRTDSYTVGLFFPRSYWIDNSLEVFDALIRELEGRGANVIAVFNDKFKGGGDDAAIEKYLIKDGSSVVDTVLFQAYFFLKSSREEGGAGFEQEKSDILSRLNVPALLMINTMQTREEYEENPEGLTVPQYIITIALPEFDGISQPVLSGVSESKIDPTTGANIQHPVPLSEQIGYLGNRIFKWCALRKKTNSEKKIAIILHNSPCRSGVEATVGAGFGLDTLESTALLMRRMKEEGYNIDWVPQNGKELIEIILERKAISEFRWTPLSEIVKKGGAAGFVALDSYRDWLEELPESSRSKIFKAWGDPFDGNLAGLGDLEKMSLALHEGKITIPGLIFGNLFIGLQPKRGCAGARCDGSVCKILHDPEIPPPHPMAFAFIAAKIYLFKLVV
ncbi:cobaltochelatase subunit CobN, partial [bacterium]|nr:cobaltochelatase subunit CobN [bacterium]